jgi:hypothetical protein
LGKEDKKGKDGILMAKWLKIQEFKGKLGKLSPLPQPKIYIQGVRKFEMYRCHMFILAQHCKPI